MKKIKNAFVYGLIVTLIINGISSLIDVLIYDLDKTIIDILYIYPISLPLFFIPCFFSFIYYQDNFFKNFKNTIGLILKPALFSFVIIFVLCFIYMVVKKGSLNWSHLTNLALPFSVFAFLTSIFSMLIVFLLSEYNKAKKKLNTIKIRPSMAMVFVHFSWITVAYFMLFHFGSSSFRNLRMIFNLFISGFSVTLFSYFSFKFIIAKVKNIYLIVSVYFVAVFVIPSILSLMNTNISLDIFIIKFKASLLVTIPYFLFLTLIIHAYFIYLINKQEKLNLKQIGVESSLKYQQLKSQISPHFLFNNISVLTGLIEENQEKAVQFSEDLSKVYRYFLDQETQDLVTLKDEIFFANKYIDLLKVRFENALIFNNKVNKTDGFYMLPMALQQVFENVVKHNTLSEEDPITITLFIEGGFLVVSNTLQPMLSVETIKQTGLENIKNRYAYFTDEKIIINKDYNLFKIKLPLLKPETK